VATEDSFHQLTYYTLAQSREEFMHQYVVDAYGAQTAGISDKPIRLVFALVGLYLHVELGCSGRQVQRIHAKLAQRKPPLPQISIPASRGTVSIADVLRAPPGRERDRKIEDWCKSVWTAYGHDRTTIVDLLSSLARQRASSA
jgi:hypothetical protein